MRPPITNDDSSPNDDSTTPKPVEAPLAETSLWRRLPPNGRLFVRFWGGASLLALICVIGLQEWSSLHHGRKVAEKQTAASPVPANRPAPETPRPAVVRENAEADDISPHDAAQSIEPQDGAVSDLVPGVTPVSKPVPDMLEPAPGEPGHNLPKPGPAGQLARNVYAAAVPAVPATNARVGILLDGYGLSEEMSLNAARTLPAMVSFAVSTYAPARPALSEVARQRGHEVFLSLPMQPSTAPMDDEGPRALGYDHSETVDRDNLRWALSRFDGYVGVTNAFSGLDGDAYAQSPDFQMVSRELNQRGLLYLNATPNAQRIGPAPGGDAAMTLDTDADAAGIDGQLAHLVQLAKTRGSAIAVAGPMRPVLLMRLAEWVKTLSTQNISLVPVSSLCRDTAPASSVSQKSALHIKTPPVMNPNDTDRKVGSGARTVTETPLATPALPAPTVPASSDRTP